MGISAAAIRSFLFTAFLASVIQARAAQPSMESGSSDASIKAEAPEAGGLQFRGFSFSGKSYLGGSSTMLSSDTERVFNQWVQLTASARHTSSGIGMSAMGLLNRTAVGAEATSDFDNPVLTLSQLRDGGEGWYSKFTYGLSAVIPGNDATREFFSYAVGPYFEWVKEIGRFTVTELASYSHGVYRGPASLGPAVVPDAVKSATTVDFNVTEKFYLEAVLQLFGSLTDESKRAFRASWSAGLGYELNKTFAVDAGFGTCYGAGQPNAHFDQLGVQEGPPPHIVFADLGVSI